MRERWSSTFAKRSINDSCINGNFIWTSGRNAIVIRSIRYGGRWTTILVVGSDVLWMAESQIMQLLYGTTDQDGVIGSLSAPFRFGFALEFLQA